MYWVSLGFLGLIIVVVTLFHPLTGVFAFMVLVLPVVGLALGLAGASAVTCCRVLSKDHVFPGETVDVELVLRNRTPLPLPWVAVVDRVGSREVRPSFRVVALGSFSTKTVRYSFVPERRGCFRVGPLTISSGDFLGGPVFERQAGGIEHITVYPRTIPMDELTLWSRIPAGDLRRRNRLIEDPSRYAGPREYADGDPQSRIHWKATARAGRLLTRRFDATISPETMIVLAIATGDFETRYSDTLVELGIEIAASLAFHLVTRHQKVGFATNGSAGPEDPGGSPLAGNSALRRRDYGPGTRNGARAHGGVETRSAPGPGPTPDPGSEPGTGAKPGTAAGGGARIGSVIAYPCRNDAGHLRQLFEVMARLGPGEGPPAADLLRLVGRDLRWGSTCIVVAPSDTDDLVREALALVRRGTDVTIVATARARHAEHLGGQGKGGLSVVEVRSSQALRERLGR